VLLKAVLGRNSQHAQARADPLEVGGVLGFTQGVQAEVGAAGLL